MESFELLESLFVLIQSAFLQRVGEKIYVRQNAIYVLYFILLYFYTQVISLFSKWFAHKLLKFSKKYRVPVNTNFGTLRPWP